ncbi:MAG: N-acetylglucosamine-6-phosphate deacetylase [Lachnospiraceae bacterium]|nr:N-acetylglucosamine-6-phosphate deacetylase [Lachnospiraceae bacterium]
MIIKHAKVLEENGTFSERTLYTEGERIAEQGSGQVIDATGLYAVPGLIDIHFHGCAGKDFCDGTAESIRTMAEYELSQGIMSICPATMTIPASQIAGICQVAGAYQSEKTEATLRGINLEGPFISPAKKGAQKEDHILAPDAGLLRQWMELSGGLCRLVCIAPEREGAMTFIDEVKDEIHISVAHTMADYDTAMEAFRRGADHITHLYNAMPGFTHRAPGVIGAGADQDHVYAELICDGVHIHPSAIRGAFKLYGSDRIVLISDSIEATGLEDGEYMLGGQPVTVRGNQARLADGTLAGSATNLMDCVRFLVKKVGVPLGTAVKCATVNPAKSIGIYDTVGSLTPGKAADVVLLDQELRIVHKIHAGELV